MQANFFRTDGPALDKICNGTAGALSVAVAWEWLSLPTTVVGFSNFVSCGILGDGEEQGWCLEDKSVVVATL